MDYERLAVELLQNMQLMQKSGQKKFVQEGVHGEAFILHCIKERECDIVPSEISSIMGISGARVATALSSLESKGLLTREIDTTDRRRILVKLTEKGKAVEEEQRRELMDKATQLLALLGENDAVDYVRIMGRLAVVLAELPDKE